MGNHRFDNMIKEKQLRERLRGCFLWKIRKYIISPYILIYLVEPFFDEYATWVAAEKTEPFFDEYAACMATEKTGMIRANARRRRQPFTLEI